MTDKHSPPGDSDTKLLPCPFCGKPGKVYAENSVGCSDQQCGAEVNFGHWCGVENGVPAVNWVIAQWNKRTLTPSSTERRCPACGYVTQQEGL
jgi:endogenous inhibitor of DNA gyrase (YacG/DUF329 family)